MTQILNIRNLSDAMISGDIVKVDRSSNWGNPFLMMGEEDRNAVCDKFEKYALWRLTIEPDWLDPLKGKYLACWCYPRRCHAETLLKLANAEKCDKCKGNKGWHELKQPVSEYSMSEAVWVRCDWCDGTGLKVKSDN